MKSINVAGIDYVIGSLNAFDQLHLARRLATLSYIIKAIGEPSNATKDHALLVVTMLGQLADADADYVVHKCLSAVSRIEKGQPVKIRTASGDLMFMDITMKVMLDLTTAVLLENLGDFFATALSTISEGAGTAG